MKQTHIDSFDFIIIRQERIKNGIAIKLFIPSKLLILIKESMQKALK